MTERVRKFWEIKKLDEMSLEEWEALCDGCGLCCLQKLEDEDDGSVYYTRIACKLLDLKTCRCKDYKHRKKFIADCITLTIDDIEHFNWLPTTCSYRRLAEGLALPEWHPLLTGDAKSTLKSGITMAGKMLCENDVVEDEWENYLIFRID